MPEVSQAEYDLLQKLKQAAVITESPYEGKGKLRIYRMRLFTPSERRALRHAIAMPNDWRCAEGCSGMMDELEMVNFEAHGKTIELIKRQI